jgi:heme-degrading monooxygenase HmoA
MIIRVWRGQSRIADADKYERFLKETAYPDYGDVPGNRGWMLLRRPLPDTVEFMFVSFWDSMEALAEYTGGDPERPKYYPEDRAALVELPELVEHYQAVDIQARWEIATAQHPDESEAK